MKYLRLFKESVSDEEFIDAASRGDVSGVERLIRSGVDLNIRNNWGWTALNLASYWNHGEVVKLLISAGADLNIRSNDGWTALIGASYKNHGEVVKLLIRSGANLNIRNIWGRTALILASRWNRIEVVKILLENFADECILDNGGWSFYDHLDDRNKEIIRELYPNEVENAIHFSEK
jgi:serine/threonine-protein phosphatase 6 regulatory ankyrin repeat subunit B